MTVTRVAFLACLLGCGQSRDAPSAHDEPLGRSSSFVEAPSRKWFRTQELVEQADGFFGSVVAMSATTAIVGSPGDEFRSIEGRVFAYALADGRLGEPEELVLEGVASLAGLSVAVSGNTAIVGTPSHPGTAHVFSRGASSWMRTDVLVAGSPAFFDDFGTAVAVDGDLIVVGAPSARSAYVFARGDDRWVQQKQLSASDNPGRRDVDRFGTAVGISGNLVVVGAPDSGGSLGVNARAGKVYVYTKPNDLSGTWQETGLVSAARRGGENFGQALAISGRSIVVGVPLSGAALVFMRDGSGWGQQRFTDDSTFYNSFGHSVAISGDRFVVGVPNLQTGARFYPGGVFVYVRDPSGGWFLEQEPLIPEISDESFGSAVGLSGDTMIVGASGADHGGAFDADLGAAYIYNPLGDAGSTCETNAECGGGHCVAGVCCDKPCAGACEHCPTGECLPVPSGSRGTPACPLSRVCDGVDGSCPATCVTNGGCIGTHYCRDGECEPKGEEDEACVGPEECLSGNCVRRRCSGTLPNGSPCREACDCTRGYCVDGLCCNDSCVRQCEACDVAGHEGECTAVRGAPHGNREPCAGAGSECEGECRDNVVEACTYPTSTECDSSCENDAETVSRCDGQGLCVAQDAVSCGKFVCDPTACKTSCESNDDCAEDYGCWADGKCDSVLRCASDYESERAPGGIVADCRPYTCNPNGSCRTSCTSSDDCEATKVCEPNGQRCVDAPTGDEGCGCRMASRGRSGTWGLVASLIVIALTRRRVRRRSSMKGSDP